ncbi:hypothetical protein DFS34DRAFT_694444 [Phlyctochytrium arcticum]|nr:hypothetical protein DFS34DRAFT_694444 [Phlyctochytrium arcticum]
MTSIGKRRTNFRNCFLPGYQFLTSVSAPRMRDAVIRYPVHEQEIIRPSQNVEGESTAPIGTPLSCHQQHLSRRQANWVGLLQELDVDSEYLPGEWKKALQHDAGHQSIGSPNTVVEWYNLCRNENMMAGYDEKPKCQELVKKYQDYVKTLEKELHNVSALPTPTGTTRKLEDIFALMGFRLTFEADGQVQLASTYGSRKAPTLLFIGLTNGRVKGPGI